MALESGQWAGGLGEARRAGGNKGSRAPMLGRGQGHVCACVARDVCVGRGPQAPAGRRGRGPGLWHRSAVKRYLCKGSPPAPQSALQPGASSGHTALDAAPPSTCPCGSSVLRITWWTAPGVSDVGRAETGVRDLGTPPQDAPLGSSSDTSSPLAPRVR